MDPRTSGRTARKLETLHALCYFAPEVEAEAVGVGVPEDRSTYFAPRSAPMGAVGPGVVTATFYVFSPTLVAPLVPACWEAASPAEVVAARFRGVDAAYRRLLGEEVPPLGSAEVAEAADLVHRASEGCAPEGRSLYAGHADLAWPEEPHLRLWHGLSLLREHRGDGHVMALQHAGLSGLEALVTHTATGRGFTQPAAQATRGWSDEEWAAAVIALTDRGLMSADGALTEAGEEQRRAVEDETNRLGAAPWDHLGDDGAARLLELGLPLVKRALAAGAFPDGVFA